MSEDALRCVVQDPAELDALIEKQRRKSDPEQRAATIAAVQMMAAKRMYQLSFAARCTSFGFFHPWARNIAWPAWNRCIDLSGKSN